MAVDSLNALQIEKLHGAVRKALAIAIYVSEAEEEHASFAGHAMTDFLHEARQILEGEEVEALHG